MRDRRPGSQEKSIVDWRECYRGGAGQVRRIKSCNKIEDDQGKSRFARYTDITLGRLDVRCDMTRSMICLSAQIRVECDP